MSSSLFPVAVVVVAFFFLFRMLGGKVEKAAQPQAPQSPPPSTRRHSSELSLRSVPADGLASFHFVEGSHYIKPTPSTPPRRHPCRICGIHSSKRCIHCKSVYYCSKEHCIQDWLTHKPHCVPSLSRSRSPSRTRPLPDAAERARGLRPGDTINVEAYFFGVDADVPRIVQVTCTLKEAEEEGYMRHSPNFKEYAQWPALGYIGVRRATPTPTAPLLSHSLSLFFHEFGLIDDQRPNRCIENLVGGPGKTYQQWVGDIMLLRDEVSDRYCDVAEEDLGPAIEYFRDYGRL
ncbi:hypothetical protein F5148DRAFT_368666 [Russula earlei]|uniref:Uncharacterized protein n=1 Tax=Russula earlei TaxID=71964 RepID=A0ACC0U0Z7_9AGAM|nr:hypothetical protein F5148DRAFT_368666 [Russula earlei]